MYTLGNCTAGIVSPLYTHGIADDGDYLQRQLLAIHEELRKRLNNTPYTHIQRNVTGYGAVSYTHLEAVVAHTQFLAPFRVLEYLVYQQHFSSAALEFGGELHDAMSGEVEVCLLYTSLVRGEKDMVCNLVNLSAQTWSNYQLMVIRII